MTDYRRKGSENICSYCKRTAKYLHFPKTNTDQQAPHGGHWSDIIFKILALELPYCYFLFAKVKAKIEMTKK